MTAKKMKQKIPELLFFAVFWLIIWAAAAAVVGQELLLPSPLAVGHALKDLILSPAFWCALAASMGRVGIGFLIGSGLGMACAGLTSRWKWIDILFSPALRAVRSVPVVSFILLLYFCLSTGWVPVVVSALTVLPVAWRAACQGIAAADPNLLELCTAYRLHPFRTFRLVRLPQALPALCTGWETGLGLAWKSGLAAEVLCQPKWAAGSGLQAAKATLDTAQVAAWTAAAVILSFLMENALRLALHRWKGEGYGGD